MVPIGDIQYGAKNRLVCQCTHEQLVSLVPVVVPPGCFCIPTVRLLCVNDISKATETYAVVYERLHLTRMSIRFAGFAESRRARAR